MGRPSIFEAVGGEAGVRRLAAEHHRRCLADPLLEHPFSRGMRPDHVERLGAYWAEVFGGPPRYSELYGGEPAMMGIHTGHGMDAEIGRRFVECFVAAQDAAGVPGDAELRGALRAYMEWAVQEVLSRQAPGDAADPGSTVPRWDWEGLR